MISKKRIAVIVAASIYNQKGLFNAVHNRVKYLNRIINFDLDVYLLSTYKGRVISFLTREKTYERPDIYEKDDVLYHLLWRKNSIVDYFLFHVLHRKEIFHTMYDKKIVSRFRDYDLLDIHSGASNIALAANERYGIPYVITWHGSDIHTSPFNGNDQMKKTCTLLENAACNFFVSNSLLEVAHTISDNFNYEILYNGANDRFRKYDEIERTALRRKYSVESKKVVAFIGNIIEVKNPFSLPEIFENIHNKYQGDVCFWIVGDGNQRIELERKLHLRNLEYRFWGNQPIERIPELLQCINVVVLPSHKEGFGMVLVEAIKCGANAVAARVGGTLEVLGDDDTFQLNENFADMISSRIVYYLENTIEQTLDKRFSWETSALKEKEILDSILNHK